LPSGLGYPYGKTEQSLPILAAIYGVSKRIVIIFLDMSDDDANREILMRKIGPEYHLGQFGKVFKTFLNELQ
jgi:hypothetical protein